MFNKKTLLTTLLLIALTFTSIITVQAATLSYKKNESKVSGELFDGLNYESFKATTITDGGTTGLQNISYVKKSVDSQVKVVAWSKLSGSSIVGSSMVDLAKDFETKNPGYKVLAGINGDYFNFTGYAPVNAMVSNSDVVKYSNFGQTRYLSIGFDNDARSYVVSKDNQVENFYSLSIYDETATRVIREIEISGFNRIPSVGETSIIFNNIQEYQDDNAVFYSIPSLDTYTNLDSYLIKGKVTKQSSKAIVSNKEATIITKDPEIQKLLDQFPYIKVQKNLKGLNNGLENVIGVGSQTLKDGNIQSFQQIVDQSEEFEKARHPRSSIGFSDDGELIIATMDGRQTNMSGVNLREQALIMKELGAKDAFNFDGGGSTQLVIRENNGFKYLNSPSENSRKVSNGVLIVVPDVYIKTDITNLSSNSLDLKYDSATTKDVELIKMNVYLNNELINETSKEFKLNNLIRYGINYLSFEAVYKKDGVTYTKSFISKRINIGNTVEKVIEKPSNFMLSFIPDYESKRLNITLNFDDPDDRLIKVYVIFDDKKEILIKGINGYDLEIANISEAKTFSFKIEYQYVLSSVTPISEIYEQDFKYDYLLPVENSVDKDENKKGCLDLSMTSVATFFVLSLGFVLIKRRSNNL